MNGISAKKTHSDREKLNEPKEKKNGKIEQHVNLVAKLIVNENKGNVDVNANRESVEEIETMNVNAIELTEDEDQLQHHLVRFLSS